ncbi:MAG: hypothetical protein ACREID_05615, partial [Planctomycetota bacterium]
MTSTKAQNPIQKRGDPMLSACMAGDEGRSGYRGVHVPGRAMRYVGGVHGLGAKDGDRVIDWGRASRDYALFRPDFPASFWRRLDALDVARPGLRVLDLGSGT